jgi:hypothetical protein
MMKSAKLKSRKLKIHRDTLRVLASNDLSRVAGGLSAILCDTDPTTGKASACECEPQ